MFKPCVSKVLELVQGQVTTARVEFGKKVSVSCHVQYAKGQLSDKIESTFICRGGSLKASIYSPL